MDKLVYALCALTSLTCAAMLWRGYKIRASKLLLWSSICFALFAVSNLSLFAESTPFVMADLQPFRNCLTLAGIGVLLYGLIWETV